MRLLVYPHDLNIGGSQINAIDLAAGAASAGHDVIVYAPEGPLAEYVQQKGLRFIPAQRFRYRPAPPRMVQLAKIVRSEGIDLIHAYEWPPCLDAYYGPCLAFNTPLLCTVLSMDVMPYVPASVPLIMGTAELGDRARETHRGKVWVLEPPIDIEQDNPDIDGEAYRRTLGCNKGDLLIVSVSRLSIELKLDALVRAIDAVDHLASSYPIKFAMVGDGPARSALEERGRAVNRRHGRDVVIFPGPQLDPRKAYAAADLVVAMGSSALRALAIGRPVIVQGEQAFSEIFEPRTYDLFLRQGFYGLADGERGSARLASQLEALIVDRDRRAAIAAFGLKAVAERFGLRRALALQMEIYEQVLATNARPTWTERLRPAYLALNVEIANHNPFRKRRRRSRELSMLLAAESGSWPPPVAN